MAERPAHKPIRSESKNLVSGRTANYLLDSADDYNSHQVADPLRAGATASSHSFRLIMKNQMDRQIIPGEAIAIGNPVFVTGGGELSTDEFTKQRRFTGEKPSIAEYGQNIAIAFQGGRERGGWFLATTFGHCWVTIEVTDLAHEFAHVKPLVNGVIDPNPQILTSGPAGPIRILWKPRGNAGEPEQLALGIQKCEGWLDPYQTHLRWARMPEMAFGDGKDPVVPGTILNDMLDPVGTGNLLYDFGHRDTIEAGECRVQYLPKQHKWRIIGAQCS